MYSKRFEQLKYESSYDFEWVNEFEIGDSIPTDLLEKRTLAESLRFIRI